jgi:hypothetical protein
MSSLNKAFDTGKFRLCPGTMLCTHVRLYLALSLPHLASLDVLLESGREQGILIRGKHVGLSLLPGQAYARLVDKSPEIPQEVLLVVVVSSRCDRESLLKSLSNFALHGTLDQELQQIESGCQAQRLCKGFHKR